MDRKRLIVLLVLSLFLMAADNEDQELFERAALGEREQLLRARIDTLKREQDFLLFQKAMYETDSRYLIINITEKTGQLKYRNRVLKGFTFVPSKNFPGEALATGVLVLKKKEERKGDRPVLVLGKALVIQWKRAYVPPAEAGIPYITLTKKEMVSLFVALEEGAMAYIVQ